MISDDAMIKGLLAAVHGCTPDDIVTREISTEEWHSDELTSEFERSPNFHDPVTDDDEIFLVSASTASGKWFQVAFLNTRPNAQALADDLVERDIRAEVTSCSARELRWYCTQGLSGPVGDAWLVREAAS
jgi:hypothetical protein